jgi:hypothetical protein
VLAKQHDKQSLDWFDVLAIQHDKQSLAVDHLLVFISCDDTQYGTGKRDSLTAPSPEGSLETKGESSRLSSHRRWRGHTEITQDDNRHADTDKHTDTQTDTQTHRGTQTETNKHKQTYRQKHREISSSSTQPLRPSIFRKSVDKGAKEIDTQTHRHTDIDNQSLF